MEIQKTTISLPKDLHKRLRHFAIEHDVSLISVIVNAIKLYLKENDDDQGTIRPDCIM